MREQKFLSEGVAVLHSKSFYKQQQKLNPRKQANLQNIFFCFYYTLP